MTRKSTVSNRSTRRTEASLRRALLDTMAQKPLNSITVQELIDRANVCRTTFYAHYHDIYDLLDSIENTILKEISHSLEALDSVPVRVEGEYPTILSVVRIYAKYPDEIRLLNSSNGDPNFTLKLQAKIYHITRRLRESKDGSFFSEERHRLYSSYVIPGGISVLNQLLSENRPWNVEAIGHVLCEMAEMGERLFLDSDY